MKTTKLERRLSRARRHHARARASERIRLVIFKSNKAIYAQLVDDSQGKILASSSNLKGTSGIEGAKLVGKEIAEKAIKLKIDVISFDRNGYPYHGQIQALADSARESGLKF